MNRPSSLTYYPDSMDVEIRYCKSSSPSMYIPRMCAVAARLKLLLHYGENIFKLYLNGEGEVYLKGPWIVAEQPIRPPGYFGPRVHVLIYVYEVSRP